MQDIPVTITVEIGRAKLSMRELLNLRQGSIIELNKKVKTPLNFFVNGKLFGMCEVVTLAPKHDKYGIKILKIFSKEEILKVNNEL